ncbi:hypothetical protein [Porphyromonas sp.]
MNKILRVLFAVGMLSLALGACKKNDPVTPTPDPKTKPAPKPAPTPDQPKPQPAPGVHFTQPEVEVRVGKSVTATLENFSGTLAQEGKVDGFAVTIKGNVATIAAEAYLPGKHTFTFKGGDKSYQLTVNLEKLPEVKEVYAVYDLDQMKPVLKVNAHRNGSRDKHIAMILYEKEDTPASGCIQVDIPNFDANASVITLDVLCTGLKPLTGDKPYLANNQYIDQKGFVVKKPDANSSILSFVTTVAGKYFYVSFDTKKQ